MPAVTPTQRLAAALLGEPLSDWVAARRARGMSWRAITANLAASTNGQVQVNRETLRTWYREDVPESVS